MPIIVNKSAIIPDLILVSSGLVQLKDGYTFTSIIQGLNLESISKSNPYNSKKQFRWLNYPTIELYTYDSALINVFMITSLISLLRRLMSQLVLVDN